MKKTWVTIDETLNRKRKSTEYPAEFFYINRTIRDLKDIANSSMSISPVLDLAYLRILMCPVLISPMMST